ncbi:hypothetical protein [Amorphus sp. MBR-141]
MKTIEEIYRAPSYAGGNPTERERFVWSYRSLRKPHYRGHARAPNQFSATEAAALALDWAASGRIRYADSAGGWNLPFKAYGSDAMRWIEAPAGCGLRFVGAAHDVARIEHTGWFLDDTQGETVAGAVYQMPARNGVPIFVAGYLDPWNDGPACLDFGGTFDDEKEAAHAADGIAERMAEESREYAAASRGRLEHDELADEIATSRTEALALIREIKATRQAICGSPSIIAALRRRLESFLFEIREARERRATLAHDFDHCAGWRDA